MYPLLSGLDGLVVLMARLLAGGPLRGCSRPRRRLGFPRRRVPLSRGWRRPAKKMARLRRNRGRGVIFLQQNSDGRRRTRGPWHDARDEPEGARDRTHRCGVITTDQAQSIDIIEKFPLGRARSRRPLSRARERVARAASRVRAVASLSPSGKGPRGLPLTLPALPGRAPPSPASGRGAMTWEEDGEATRYVMRVPRPPGRAGG